MDNTHWNNLYFHVQKRAFTHWGLELEWSDIDMISRKINIGLSIGVFMQDNLHSTHVVEFRKMNIPVLYDPTIQFIRTVWPWDKAIILWHFGDIREGKLFNILPVTGKVTIINQEAICST